jgi:hypothetical protein
LNAQSVKREFIGSWLWLFPASYLLHITEEYLGGFPQWIARIGGVESSNANFLSWNIAALVLMAASVFVVQKTRSLRWLPVGYGAAFVINGLAHAISSVITMTYSPGLLSGTAIFLPLGVFTLRRGWTQVNPRTFRAGVIVGVLMHVAVVLLAFGFARISR